MTHPEPNARLIPLRLQGTAVRWRIGLVVLASDPTIEDSFRQMLDQTHEVALHGDRIAFSGGISVDNLKSMQGDIQAAAATLLPGQPLNAVLYGCTSAAVAIGDDTVRGLLTAAKPGTRRPWFRVHWRHSRHCFRPVLHCPARGRGRRADRTGHWPAGCDPQSGAAVARIATGGM